MGSAVLARSCGSESCGENVPAAVVDGAMACDQQDDGVVLGRTPLEEIRKPLRTAAVVAFSSVSRRMFDAGTPALAGC